MRHPSIADFLLRFGPTLATGPVCIVMAEDDVAVAETVRHHFKAGFRSVVLLAPEGIVLPPDLEPVIHVITYDVFAEAALPNAVNALVDACSGAWVYYCYNGEFLFYPFCETRTVREMLTFHTEERREAMLTYVVDLYAGNLDQYPNAVALEDAYIDRSGYFALARKDAARNWEPKERQLDFFGGLRWRFEEHIPWPRRKIDRISLFRARRGLRLAPDYTLNEDELNTYACPWHNNLTAAVCSFRTAKALRTNPGSRHAIPTFHWHNSVSFAWHSQQLLDLGLIEPGQWF